MNRRRIEHRGLTLTRIYRKGRQFYYFAPAPVEDPKTGKVGLWHNVGPVAAGEDAARARAREIIAHNSPGEATGDMPEHVEAYRLGYLKKREKERPREPARIKIFEQGNKEFSRVCRVIKEGFAAFDVAQVRPADIAVFVDQWEGQRSAQVYKARLSDFFAWASRKGLRNDNPAREVKVEKTDGRTRYITHEEFHKIRDALLVGDDGRPTPSGRMVQAYVDLCYLFYQRTTEIRLLKWSDVTGDSMLFQPTKTEKSSGAKVAVPITPAARAALEQAKAAGKIRSVYVIHTLHGQPYDAHGLGTAWRRACQRAGVADATLKDLRAKSATDAKKQGFTEEQISVGLAHTSVEMTQTYIREIEAVKSEIVLALPPKN